MNSIRLVIALSIAFLAGCVAVPAQRVVYVQPAPAGTVQSAPPVVYVQPAPVYYYPAPAYYPYYWGPPVILRFGGYRGGHRGRR